TAYRRRDHLGIAPFFRMNGIDGIDKVRRVLHEMQTPRFKMRLHRPKPEIADTARLENVVEPERTETDEQAWAAELRETHAVLGGEFRAPIDIDVCGRADVQRPGIRRDQDETLLENHLHHQTRPVSRGVNEGDVQSSVRDLLEQSVGKPDLRTKGN